MIRSISKLAQTPKISIPQNTLKKQGEINRQNPSLFDLSSPLGKVRSILAARLPDNKKEDVLGLKNTSKIQAYLKKINQEETVLGVPNNQSINHMGANPQKDAPKTAIDDARNITVKEILGIISKIV